eukprot:scaffold141681_cov33-Tisochrysis_lutea.AAC.2
MKNRRFHRGLHDPRPCSTPTTDRTAPSTVTRLYCGLVDPPESSRNSAPPVAFSTHNGERLALQLACWRVKHHPTPADDLHEPAVRPEALVVCGIAKGFGFHACLAHLPFQCGDKRLGNLGIEFRQDAFSRRARTARLGLTPIFILCAMHGVSKADMLAITRGVYG